MNIVNLIQGTPEWHAHRANHFNASDAPAMMGVSSYKKRAQLLDELATGITQEVDAHTQRRFDDGHRFEAMARPLAEDAIGDELYPVVGNAGKLSASFDGLTLTGDVAFEHKTLNNDLRAAMTEGCTGQDLPMQYQVQMEQQCMVSGCTRVYFLATKWAGDELIEQRSCWYTPNPDLAAKITAGWEQFEADLAAHKPQAKTVTQQGKAPDQLPALSIQVTGEVTASNLAAFKDCALAVFADINRELSTDQDFADAETTVKWCADVEAKLAAAKEQALGQTASIDALFKTIDDISAEARRVRLDLDKLVKARKDEIKREIVADARKQLAVHIESLNERIGKALMPLVSADFDGAIKGKRSVDSLRAAVADTLSTAKIEANAVADRISVNLRTINAAPIPSLFPDLANLVLKAADDLHATITARTAEHEQAQAKAEQAKAEQAKVEQTIVPVAKPTPIKAVAKPTRPSNAEIIEVLANHFGVGNRKVMEWLREIDCNVLEGQI